MLLDGGQREFAGLLGVTRVTANRALARPRRDGLVGPARDGGIEILAPAPPAPPPGQSALTAAAVARASDAR
ncbi:helix-turn-helix domain-containing protein [Streptomyces sp. NPDC101225]|uniref:helix-turn-helix domain-containing protein n=1 Tax=Streptomyces sp. NPDC101225 TaxID=3366135 RepID=UPI0037F734B9